MNAKDLRAWIDDLTQDIALCYDGYAVDAHSVDDAMNIPFICGKSLSQICDQLDI